MLLESGLALKSESLLQNTIEPIQELITAPGDHYIPIPKLTRPAQTPCALLQEVPYSTLRPLQHGKINRSTTWESMLGLVAQHMRSMVWTT
jgi:hypothetical protein